MSTSMDEMRDAVSSLIPDNKDNAEAKEENQVTADTTEEQPSSEQKQEETAVTAESEDTTDSSLTQEQETEATTESVDSEASTPAETGDNAKEEQPEPLEFDNVNDYVDHLMKEVEEDEELATLLKERFAPKESPFANEELAKLNKFVAETGRGLREYQFINELDTQDMGLYEAVFYKASLENPELNSEELGLLIKDQYKLDEDDFSEREIQLGKIQLKKDGNEAVKYLNNLKEEYSKPVDGYTAQSQKTSQESPNLLGTDSEKYLSSLKEDTAIESFTFELDDKNNFEFTFDNKYGDNLYNTLANDKDPLSFVRNNDGSLNTEELAKMVALYQNGDKIVKSAYSQGKSDNAKSIATAKKNVDFQDERQDAPVPEAKNEQQEAYGEVLAKMGFK